MISNQGKIWQAEYAEVRAALRRAGNSLHVLSLELSFLFNQQHKLTCNGI